MEHPLDTTEALPIERPTIKPVNAVRLWNGTLVDLNAIAGFAPPNIRHRYTGLNRFVPEFYMEFVIHCHPAKIIVNENLPIPTFVILEGGATHRYIKATKENVPQRDGATDRENIFEGWLRVDGYYTTVPDETLICFHEFEDRFNDLVKVWNNGNNILGDIHASPAD